MGFLLTQSHGHLKKINEKTCFYAYQSKIPLIHHTLEIIPSREKACLQGLLQYIHFSIKLKNPQKPNMDHRIIYCKSLQLFDVFDFWEIPFPNVSFKPYLKT